MSLRGTRWGKGLSHRYLYYLRYLTVHVGGRRYCREVEKKKRCPGPAALLWKVSGAYEVPVTNQKDRM